MNKLSFALFAVVLFVVCSMTADGAGSRGLDARDLVRLERASAPTLSPDGRHLVFAVREIDPETGAARGGLWHRDLATRDMAPPRRLTPSDHSAGSPAFAPDGTVYFLSSKSGSMQIWNWAWTPIHTGTPSCTS